MKIFVIHGEDILGSYARLTKFTAEAKKRNWEISDYSIEAVTTPSLFGKERFFVLKDFKLLTKNHINILSKYPGNLVIYFEGELPAAFLNSLPKDAKKELFELPKIIFRFLETFSLKLFHQLIESQPPELVFSMLSRHLRDLYWVKVDSRGSNFPSWKLGKLKSQASKFSEQELGQIIERVSDIDYEVKTGKADIITALDLLIIKNLQ
jgi:DNA polymerase III delta subunit